MDTKISSLYIRVRTTYYKKIKKPLLSGDFIESLTPWSLDVIKQDFGRKWTEIFDQIEKYDGFCNIPSHVNYQRSYEGFYNQYEPLLITPAKGDFEHIYLFLKHIFQEHLDIGLDYLTILFRLPTELLPVLVLVSFERGTGKSTFLALLKAIFGANMTYNSNEDFRSNFNDSWVNKLIIAIDEVLLDRREDSEKIKNLSTARTYKVEAKGVDRSEIEFFGKFILCSNNEEDFIAIDPLETRYWIRKVQPLKELDPFMFEKMKKEIPAFMYFLGNRQIVNEKKSRMWFTPEALVTDSLLKVKRRFRNKVEVELLNIISEIVESFELDVFQFTNKDAIELLKNNNMKVTRSEVKRIIDGWSVSVSTNAFNYTTFKYDSSGIVYESHQKGRFYSLESSRIREMLML
ncbi:primase-helicase family protein [Sphingobacterium thalpophilum]|uniref:Primase-helicase family protein n=1 Tax=Sphingobacterium thalpophilum TaxID=259 RepID=A0ABV4HCM2_9SPHI